VRMGAPLTAVVSGVLVLLLHLGLLLVEAGAVRRKNVASVFTRGLACLMVTVVLSWVCGFALAMSEGNPFVGTSTGYFGLHTLPAAAPSWFLATTVAAVPAALAAAPRVVVGTGVSTRMSSRRTRSDHTTPVHFSASSSRCLCYRCSRSP